MVVHQIMFSKQQIETTIDFLDSGMVFDALFSSAIFLLHLSHCSRKPRIFFTYSDQEIPELLLSIGILSYAGNNLRLMGFKMVTI